MRIIGVKTPLQVGAVSTPSQDVGARARAPQGDVAQNAGRDSTARSEYREAGLALAAGFEQPKRIPYGLVAQNLRAVSEYTANQQQDKRSEIAAMLGVDYYA